MHGCRLRRDSTSAFVTHRPWVPFVPSNRDAVCVRGSGGSPTAQARDRLQGTQRRECKRERPDPPTRTRKAGARDALCRGDSQPLDGRCLFYNKILRFTRIHTSNACVSFVIA
ncbi:hypothetical protein MRX96_025945 [Rhipicephalus microplus]